MLAPAAERHLFRRMRQCSFMPKATSTPAAAYLNTVHNGAHGRSYRRACEGPAQWTLERTLSQALGKQRQSRSMAIDGASARVTRKPGPSQRAGP